MPSSSCKIVALIFHSPTVFWEIIDKTPRSEANLRPPLCVCEPFKDVMRKFTDASQTLEMSSGLNIPLVPRSCSKLQPMRADAPLLPSAAAL